MKKFRWLLGAMAALMLAATAFAGDEVDLKDVKCVLNSKGAAKATSSAQYNGGTVYFCCDNCKGKFTAEPKKYAAAANAQAGGHQAGRAGELPVDGQAG